MAKKTDNNSKINKESGNVQTAHDKGVNSTDLLGLTTNQFVAMKKLASLNSFNLLDAIDFKKVYKKFFKLLR